MAASLHPTPSINSILSKKELLVSKPKKDALVATKTIDQYVDDLTKSFNEVLKVTVALDRLKKGQYIVFSPTDETRDEKSRGVPKTIRKESKDLYAKAYRKKLEDVGMHIRAATVKWNRFAGIPGRREEHIVDGKIKLKTNYVAQEKKAYVYGKLLNFYRDIVARGLLGQQGRELPSTQPLVSLGQILAAARARQSNPAATDASDVASFVVKVEQAITQAGAEAGVIVVNSKFDRKLMSIYNSLTSKTVYSSNRGKASADATNRGKIPFNISAGQVWDMTHDGLAQPSVIVTHYGNEIEAEVAKRRGTVDEKDHTKSKEFDPTKAKLTDFSRIVKISTSSLSKIGKVGSKIIDDIIVNNADGQPTRFEDISAQRLNADIEVLKNFKISKSAPKQKNIFDVITVTGDKSHSAKGDYGTNPAGVGMAQLYAISKAKGDANAYKRITTEMLGAFDRHLTTMVTDPRTGQVDQSAFDAMMGSPLISGTRRALVNENHTATALERLRVNAAKAAKRRAK